MIQLEISENNFSRKLSSSYELSILYRVDSFVYMATDNAQQVLLLKDHQLQSSTRHAGSRLAELRDIAQQDPLLRQRFRRTRIGVVTNRHTLVPNRLYNPQEKKTYLEQLTTLADNCEVVSDDLPELAVQNVFAFPKPFLDFFREQFSESRFFHSTTGFLLGHRAASALPEGYHLFMHIHSRRLQLLLYDGPALQFVNSFSCQNSKDFIYYVMLVFDQFSLSPETVPVFLSGEITNEGEVYQLLTRYIRNVQTMPAPPFLRFGAAFDNLPGYRYYDLFSLSQCN